MKLVSHSLTNAAGANSITFSETQNKAILIAGLTCACLSLAITIITLRWFVLMKRTFRHRLILFLICSDTVKSVWYFIFPIVVFTRGPIRTHNKFCQVSGFFLALGIETTDFSIFLIALHSILYIFNPSTRSSDSGGLYRWRKWLYVVWIGVPLLFASLAFVNQQDAYSSAGAYCYLPRRPFWYRLALSWIPRYFILTLIFWMYAAVYIYVTIKFRTFSHLSDSDDQFSSQSHSHFSSYSPQLEGDVAPDEVHPPKGLEKRPALARPGWSRQSSYRNEMLTRPTDPWDEVSFITTKALRDNHPGQSSRQASDSAASNQEQNNSPTSMQPPLRLDPLPVQNRQHSACTTDTSAYTGDTVTVPAGEQMQKSSGHVGHQHHRGSTASQRKTKDPLKRTRSAIRKQLRYLFIYPAVYVLMWIFPFVSHCLLYDDYYVQHPIYWLTVLQTCMLALQAAADCIVFSWREKPWRRIPEDSKFAVKGISDPFARRKSSDKSKSTKESDDIVLDEQAQAIGHGRAGGRSGSSSTSKHWWEAEGLKRKDSIWLGSDSGDIEEVNRQRRNTLSGPLTTIISEDDGEAAEEREYRSARIDKATGGLNSAIHAPGEQD